MMPNNKEIDFEVVECSLKQLYSELHEANSYYSLDMRHGTKLALSACAKFIQSLPPLSEDNLSNPIVQLLAAMSSLENGADAPELFEPVRDKKGGSPGYNNNAQLIKAIAVYSVDRLNTAGEGRVPLDESYSIVWRQVQKYEHVLSRKPSDSNPVRNWRKDLAAEAAGPVSPDDAYGLSMYRFLTSFEQEPPDIDKPNRIKSETNWLVEALNSTFGKPEKISDNP